MLMARTPGQKPTKSERLNLKAFKDRRFKYQIGEEIIEFGNADVPKVIEAWRMWRIVQQRQSAKCFYTGEECVIRTKNTGWTVTEEHLIPKSRGGFRERGNNVIAASWINNLFGNAPLQIKIRAKKQLDKIACHPKLDPNQRRKIYEKVANQVLEKYKINDRFPWNEFPMRTSESDRKLFEKAMRRLQNEERKLIANRLKKCNNVKNTIERMIRSG